ncbi:leucine-rich repeat protein [Artemisia annua]|uniref:non-specific serine/threonine protein kinase n=1 Tax=Artemisia annua TaxID=35608 RepID=A0A2U1KZD4_ARTAN|nr:leucine-rich repeat protein [Artemisia annua]
MKYRRAAITANQIRSIEQYRESDSYWVKNVPVPVGPTSMYSLVQKKAGRRNDVVHAKFFMPESDHLTRHLQTMELRNTLETGVMPVVLHGLHIQCYKSFLSQVFSKVLCDYAKFCLAQANKEFSSQFALCLTSANVSASYGGNETDYLALLSFKSKITHDPYEVLTSWNHSFHFCEWSGISCGKRHKRVIALQLGSQGLEGSLSPHVGNLSFLRELSLKNNSFQGTIPHELGRLSRLRHLYLDENKFSGVIPTNFSGCSNLEDLWLNLNELTGSIPKGMSLLSKLACLYIEDNKLTGGIPPFLGNITSMKEFSAVGNPFGGSIPDTLGLWKSLTLFQSGGCNLSGSIPHSIFNVSLLVRVSLAENQLSGSLPSEIGNQLPNLKYFQLRNNKLSGVLPHSISNCSKLRKLEMSENNFSGKLTINFSKLRDISLIVLRDNNFHGRGEADDMRFIDSLKNCTTLVKLELHNCNLRGVLPKSIGNLSQLMLLGLAENQIFGSLPSSIGSLVGLTGLSLGANQFKGKIPSSIGKLQKLQRLGLYINQFSGPIPDAIGNLSLLTELYLHSNKLEGHIPPTLGNCTKLNGLSLADNRLSGKIPKQLLQLPSLTHFLVLSQNSLSGSVPSEIKNLKMLSYLDLSDNNLSGTITSSLGECISLTELYLSGNIFEGIIPSSLSSLRGLGVLDISQNNLSGKIPQFLDKWNSLEFLNLSFNDFEGEVPVVGVFANVSLFSVLGNNRLCGGLVRLKLPKCKETGSKKKRFPFFLLLILIVPALLVVLCCVYLLCKKKRNSQPSQSSRNERFLKVSYNELLKATDGFSTENLIGEGGFSSVYKGILDSHDDRFVAIKVLHLQNRGAHKSFLAECEAWRSIRHRNLLKIITSCSSVDFQGNDFKALVYEFMPNGSAHDWLHSSANTSKLNLLQRINILRDVATVLDYLHNRCQTTIVHGDLKPSNILLNDDMVAHVGDFGLARLLGADLNQSSSTGVKGTIGYAPPEYGIGSQMTSSGDVYSFGILLLEVMTGKRPTNDMFNEGLSLHKYAYMALPDHVIDVIDDDAIVLQSTEANAKKMEECLVAIIKIGVSCSVDSPPQRMKIENVVNELQRILDATDGFSTENLIGEGGFSSVYKGILDSHDDRFVAIKVLHLQNRGAHKSFLAECEAWRSIRHRNLLKIITSCSSVDFQGNDFKALVYEFMPNGSAHDWLHSSANTSKLNLLQRINILRDVATVLDYLHNRCQTTIVHGDLKPSNILLNDDMVAHVGDFGLARLLGADLNQSSSTGVKGTIGYAPPEYGIGSQMTSSGDVYSFGILLLEVMTGKRPTNDMFNEGLSLHKYAYMALPDHVIDVIDDDAIVLQSTEANAKKMEECLVAIIKIGVSCSVDSPPQRMKIENVVNELQRILDVLQNI